MQHDTTLSAETRANDCRTLATAEVEEKNLLIRSIRSETKRRRRLYAWLMPLIAVGMVSTLFVFSRVDIRLSLMIFAVSALLVAVGLARKALHWERLANRAVAFGEVRAIGSLLSVLNDRDTGACDTIEEALIHLLPRVRTLGQLSRTARQELKRLLMEYEMPGLRGGHNADLARTALETVARLRDCSALPAVRRLAEGFTATRPSAEIRDLAHDILPDLEQRAALLRPCIARPEAEDAYLRAAAYCANARTEDELVRPATVDEVDSTMTASDALCLRTIAGVGSAGVQCDVASRSEEIRRINA